MSEEEEMLTDDERIKGEESEEEPDNVKTVMFFRCVNAVSNETQGRTLQPQDGISCPVSALMCMGRSLVSDVGETTK